MRLQKIVWPQSDAPTSLFELWTLPLTPSKHRGKAIFSNSTSFSNLFSPLPHHLQLQNLFDPKFMNFV
jgi:hypothetical protein